MSTTGFNERGEKCGLDETESQILVRWFLHRGSLRPSRFSLSARPQMAHVVRLSSVLSLGCFLLPTKPSSAISQPKGKNKKSQHLGSSAAPRVRLPWRWEHTGVPDNESVLIITLFQPSFLQLPPLLASQRLRCCLSNFGAACDSTAGRFGHSSVTSLNFLDKCGAPSFKSCFTTL